MKIFFNNNDLNSPIQDPGLIKPLHCVSHTSEVPAIKFLITTLKKSPNCPLHCSALEDAKIFLLILP